MYQVGERVVYGIHGVCRVVEEQKRIVDRKSITYLALESVAQAGARFFVPTHNAAAMAKVRAVMTDRELNDLLASDAVRADAWIRDENQRKQAYRALIAGCDRIQLTQMIHTLYRHKEYQLAAGKKVHLCDENFLRDAEKMLISEISVVLNLTAEEAKAYLRKKLAE